VNELNFAKEIAKKLRTENILKYVSQEDCLKEINNIIKAYDEPFSDPSQIPTFILCKFVKKKITVALSGEGADELFGGYPRYKNISSYWKKTRNIPDFFKSLSSKLSLLVGSSDYSLLRSIGKKMRKISHKDIESIYNDEMSRWRPDEKMYNSKLLKNTLFDIRFDNKWAEYSHLRYLMIKDILTYLPSNLLVKTDRASMSNSLEIRSPYLDDEIVNFAWSLPDEYIYKNEEKVILKSILREKFSEKLVFRKKQGFEPPLYKWLTGNLNEWARDLMHSDDAFLNKKKCIKLMERLEKGENKLTYKIWTIIMFKAWKNFHFSK